MLPKSDFKWIDPSFIDDILQTQQSEDIGYILEVDLHYPEHLHDKHNDFPLAPEKTKITTDMLSNYQLDLIQKLAEGGYKHIKTQKLVTNFAQKIRYTIHIENLRFYLKKGLILEKVHRIIGFKQEKWIAPYVSLCTRKRQAATTSFEKDFWKLLVNSLYGKSIEDKRKHVNIKLVMKDCGAEKLLKSIHLSHFWFLMKTKRYLRCVIIK